MMNDIHEPTKTTGRHLLFVPFSEELLAATGSPLGELVPYRIEYHCVRLLDGTYDFSLPVSSRVEIQSSK